MARTKRRGTVSGVITAKQAIMYGIALGVLGFAILAAYTNVPTIILGIIGLFFYLVMYSIWKRRSPIGTVVGSVSGATPIAAGYTAASGHFDLAAAILFLIMVFWQMPHFYAIAMYRLKDYQAAGLPVLPAKKSVSHTQNQILAYIVAFTITAASLTVFGYTGYIYFAIIVATGVIWLLKATKSPKLLTSQVWGRQVFLFSLITLLTLSVLVSLGNILP